MDYQPIPEGKDLQLWRIAHKRASFKSHLMVYIVINLFFWVIWYFTKREVSTEFNGIHFPWPVWPMLGWGIGLFFHFMGAYVYTEENSVEREYNKLKQKSNKL